MQNKTKSSYGSIDPILIFIFISIFISISMMPPHTVTSWKQYQRIQVQIVCFN